MLGKDSKQLCNHTHGHLSQLTWAFKVNVMSRYGKKELIFLFKLWYTLLMMLYLIGFCISDFFYFIL